jgi:cytoskeleton protein RodZ
VAAGVALLVALSGALLWRSGLTYRKGEASATQSPVLSQAESSASKSAASQTSAPIAELPSARDAAGQPDVEPRAGASGADPNVHRQENAERTLTSSSSTAETQLDLIATEPSWISVSDGTGKMLLSRLVVPGTPQNIRLNGKGVLRVGNAGGLEVRLDGKPLGPIGPSGKIREVHIEDGAATITAPN